jgi:pimeloyl-ACP methyl ester carboxylesterase
VNTVDLTAGPVEYEDTGGGPVLVFLHGLLMDSSLWTETIKDLAKDHRCIAPTLPFGAHRRPMNADADLSLSGIATLVTEFLDRLDLHDVTVIGNDTGGAITQLLMISENPRIASAVLISCEAFGNFPARVTGTTLVRTGKLSPAMFGAFMQQMRLRPVRRQPIAFGWLTKRGDAQTRAWMTPVLTDKAIRTDTVKMLRAISRDKLQTEEVAAFKKPAQIIWASQDRVMPPAHASRLAELLPGSTVHMVDDSYALIPLDQPARLAALIAEFAQRAK